MDLKGNPKCTDKCKKANDRELYKISFFFVKIYYNLFVNV